MSSPTSKDINVIIQQQRPPPLKDFRELIGILDGLQSAGNGLLQIRIAGLERCVPEEMELALRPLLGKRTSILRVGDYWSAVEVINHV